MELRCAGPADVEALIRLRFAFLEEFRHISAETKQALEPQLRGYFVRHLGAEDFLAILGTEGEDCVCTAFLTVGESPPNDQYPNGRIGYVFNVYTPPAHRKRGHAGRVMHRLVEEARGRGVTAINLNASAAGRPIYERIGFHTLTDTAMRLQLHAWPRL